MIGQADLSEEDILLGQLLDVYDRGGIDRVLGGLPELRTVAGCQALVELGQHLRYRDPDGSAACVACAEVLAAQLRPGELDERDLEDFRCEMSLQMVWSWMDLKRMSAAEAALGRAGERLLKGTRDPIRKARLLDTWTVFLGHLGDFDKARQAARAALAHYEKAGERHGQGLILYRLSIIEARSGETKRCEESLRCASAARARLDPADEPNLYLRVVHQEVGCLVDLERYREARIRLFESLGHYRRYGTVQHEIERAVLEGLSNAGLGKVHAAQRELITALYGLWAAGDPYFFGILGLELCALYLEEGFEAEVQAGARKLLPVLQLEPPPAGGRKALLYLEIALDEGTVDAGLLRRLARYLRELLHDPNAPFRLPF